MSRGNPSSGRQVSDLTPPMTTNESAPDPTAGECTCGEFAGTSVRYVDCPVHCPATPPADDAGEDQPPGFPGYDASWLPPAAAAAERVLAFVSWFGDGELFGGEVPLFARDLEALAREAAAATKARADERERIAQAIEAGVLSSHPSEHYKDGFRRAARIARDAEHERDVAAMDRMNVTLAETVRLHFARAEAAERALADLRGEIEALADRFDKGAYGARFGWVIAADLRALLSRDDTAGAGGAE